MPTKVCPRCKSEKNVSEFHKRRNTRDGLYRICKSCNCASVLRSYHENPQPTINRSAVWAKENRERSRQHKNESQRSLRPYYRKLALDHYGHSCVCCGEAEEVFLEIDHINNDGALHRDTEKGLRGSRICQWLVKQGFPSGFQVLCRNCNFAKFRNKGVCPHRKALSDRDVPGYLTCTG